VSAEDGPLLSYTLRNAGKHVQRIVRQHSNGPVLSRLVLPCIPKLDSDAEDSFDYSYLRLKNAPSRAKGKPVRIVDLFCGCGGLSLGASEACSALGLSFTPVMAVDISPSCVEVYDSNLGASSLKQDIRKLLDGHVNHAPTGNERQVMMSVGRVDLLVAGPPCQGNSDLNNYTRRNDARNSLYVSVARFVELVRPNHVLIENVPAVRRGKEGALRTSLDVIEDLGYQIDSGVVNLSELGVPQRRKRHIVAASLRTTPSISDTMAKYKVSSRRSAWWAIADLEHAKSISLFNTPAKHTKQNMKRIGYLHRHNVYDLPNRLRPPCQKQESHTYKSMYGRIKRDEPIQTVTSGYGSPGQGRFVHPTQLRTLTPHEAARLQFFPDFFDFSAVTRRTLLADMIGNAAPMKLSFVFALEMLGSR